MPQLPPSLTDGANAASVAAPPARLRLGWPLGVAVVAAVAGVGLAAAAGAAGGGGALLAAGGVGLAWWLTSRPVSPAASAVAELPGLGLRSDDQGTQLMVSRVVPVWRRQLDATRDNAAEGLSQILANFSDIAATAEALSGSLDRLDPAATAGDAGAGVQEAVELRQASARLREQIDQALVGFQWGDRVDQMLSIVSADMTQFARWVADHPAATPADVAVWLASLERSYTMDEQRSRHHGNAHVERDAVVEFF